MTSVLIRNVSDETHRALVRRAEERGQSLQQYLVAELTELAARATPDDVMRRIDARSGGRVGFAEAVADLAAERARP
jgi:antitoxin FitA